MEARDYIFLNTYYDKELLRRALIVLNQEGVDFRITDKSGRGSARAPLSAYVEADIMVLSSDFERASQLLGLPAE